jgi:mannose-6-phosphate isomerase-like protein (cupin superfamily)
MIPVRTGETVGVYNPGEAEVSFAWLATAMQKGKYTPEDVGNDLVKKPFEEPCPFTWIPMDYGGFRITIPSAHQGKGPIYDTFGRLSKTYYKTLWGAFYLILPKGTSIGYHRHDIHEELYFVVKGKARGTVDDITLDLRAGDCTLCPLESSHGIYNSGSEDLGIICTLHSSLPSGEWGAKDLGDDLTKR